MTSRLRKGALAGVTAAAFALAAAGCASSSAASNNSAPSKPKPAAPVSCVVTQKIGNDGAYNDSVYKQYDFKDGLLLIEDSNDQGASQTSVTISAVPISSLSPAGQKLAKAIQVTLPKTCQ